MAIKKAYYYFMGLLLSFFIIPCPYRYDIMEPADGKWGASDENGSWVGAVGMVHRKVIHVTLGSYEDQKHHHRYQCKIALAILLLELQLYFVN